LYFYRTDTVKKLNGDDLSRSPAIDIFGNIILSSYVTKKKVLGANYAFTVALPILNAELALPSWTWERRHGVLQICTSSRSSWAGTSNTLMRSWGTPSLLRPDVTPPAPTTILVWALQDPKFSGRIPGSAVEAIAKSENVSVDDLMLSLLPLARSYSRAPISNFFVGVTVRGASGSLYLGANIEISGQCLGFAVHAEQSALSNAYMNSEQSVTSLAVAGGAPCGHCRQFMEEMSPAGEILILIPNQPASKLASILPAAFGPAALGATQGALPVRKASLSLTSEPPDTLATAALVAACRSYSVAIADVNGDGKPDIVVANTGGGNNGNGSVGVLLGNGDGTFRPAMTYDSGGQGPDSVAVADVNLDGKPDLLVANGCFGINCTSGPWIGVLLGNGDGSFQPAVTYDNGGLFPKAIATADVNADGKPDMLVANFYPYSLEPLSVGVRLGNGNGTFQSVVNYGTDSPNGASSVVAADVNLDSKPDLLVANYSIGGVGVLLGNGNGTFQPVATYTSGGSDTGGPGLAVADVNGDGKPDLLVANYAGYCAPICEGAVDVLLGNGDGTFQSVVSYSSGGSYGPNRLRWLT